MFAERSGLSAQHIPREVTKFKNYHIGKGIRMLDWDRVWQNWCIRAVEYFGSRGRSTDVRSSRSLVSGLFGPDFERGQS